ncbi:hypothetical protein UFOVP128_69 [uncultured Caudovirales phage]|uniref:Uncharacterized protein n=1 Tax=uncultured Caudovirales phage TaxID=2100421 RepID=A0A6J5L9M6_9CAUD|nr:hypothetical protein UFOVP128_69 [uncultured Caudovirales phage]CAB5222081.1 hypothetical protein UFOVP243_50 [uncultured Caudovirales phage]
MITETYLAKAKPSAELVPFAFTSVPKHFTAFEIHQATARGITPEEFVRRNNIVQALASKVALRPGDTAYPDNKSGYHKYGACLVIGVCRSYKDFSFDDAWPENDCPMIITFAPLNDRNSHIHCTYHYLVHKNPHLITC